jgi:signal transduction histidine kinase
MRVVQIAVGAAALLLLLVWLLLYSAGLQVDTAHLAVTTLDKMTLAESALRSDLLRARSGLLNNYDPVVVETGALRDAVADLRGIEAGDVAALQAINDLARTVDLQEAKVEEFKSRNALLRNSLAYFRRFTARLIASHGDNPRLAQQVSALTEAMLHLSLDTSPAVVEEVDRALSSFAAEVTIPEQAGLVDGVLAHGRMLGRLLPATDAGIKALFAVPIADRQESVRRQAVVQAISAERKAKVYQYVLYGVFILLLGGLIRLGFQLQSRARQLLHRAAIEHVIATFSTDLIGARNGELQVRIVRALGALADCIGADRAYFITRHGRPYFCSWTSLGTGAPPGWPDESFIGAIEQGTRDVYHGAGTVAAGKKRLAPAPDVQAWLCITNLSGERGKRILGFEALQSDLRFSPGELGLYRMAFDAIAQAVIRAALESERERLQWKLQHARRMETIGTLASGVAHNFNNIVGAILGYAEIAQTQVPAGAAESLVEIVRAGHRARDLIDQILSFGRRRGEMNWQTIAVGELMDDVRRMVEATLDPNVTIAISEGNHPTAIEGQAAQLQQVLVNIGRNAAQAIEGSGTIQILADCVVRDTSLDLASGRLPPGSYVRISISDNGKGMDETTRARIFEPFFTTRPDGNGLGLSTALEIVREHGGGINVESSLGSGSRFDVWLPSHGSSEIAAANFIEFAGSHIAGEPVLVCDSDRNRLLKSEEILAALGYEPVGYRNLTDAIDACRAEPDRFTSAVLCIGGSLAPVVERIVTLHRTVPKLSIVLALSSAAELLPLDVADAGIADIIGLPITTSELLGALGAHRRVGVPA